MTVESQALEMAQRAQRARQDAADRSAAERSSALTAIATAIETAMPAILAANASDMDVARDHGRPPAFLDRLMLDEARLGEIAAAVRQIAEQNDPLGEVIEHWQAPSGVDIHQVRVPIGVLGVIFEARPNVTADAAALAVRSGNAVLLRSGSDSLQSAQALVAAIRTGLQHAGFPADLVQHPDTADRAFVGAMLSGLEGQLDLVIPRGGKALVARVQAEARIPVLGHLDGICHAYLHPSADPDMARDIILNAKLRRTGVCNALECLLVDRAALETHWKPIARALADAGCELRADDALRSVFPDAVAAQDSDWGQEFLDAILAARVVDGLDEAMAHIARYGSGHTDLVLAADASIQERFLNSVDSAVVIANASTGFSDGGEFGFGAEIGIATSRLHARGPVGARQLTSYKYVVRGQGEVRG
ncbi:MAG: glutamate-5-semialdehyde dehydrogenase [Pseudomonadota bacterium]|nr:glutamate-5-semialdehyde dehydrogenase [Pseudomonadota bacterium]